MNLSIQVGQVYSRIQTKPPNYYGAIYDVVITTVENNIISYKIVSNRVDEEFCSSIPEFFAYFEPKQEVDNSPLFEDFDL